MTSSRSSSGQEIVPAAPSSGAVEVLDWLDDLAIVVEREHLAANAAVNAVLQHAILAGEGLLDAQAQLDEASFERWVEARGIHYRTAQKYMRLASYKDELTELPEFYDLSMTRANLYLRGLPRRIGPNAEAREAMIAEIKRLHLAKMPERQIARTLGVTRHTVRYHTDPNFARDKKRERAQQIQQARSAERQRETERRLREQGGSLPEGYYLIRRAYLQVKKASTETHNLEERRDLERALKSLNEAEGWIERAIRSDLPAARRPKVQRSRHA